MKCKNCGSTIEINEQEKYCPICGDTLNLTTKEIELIKETKNKKVKKTKIIKYSKLISIFVIILCVIAIPLVRDFKTISETEYNKITNGMSYDEVVKIIGCKGTPGEGEDGFIVYTWKGNSKDIALVKIIFKDGTVFLKQSFRGVS